MFHSVKMNMMPSYIYIYAFSRHFYPKRLTVHSGYTCIASMLQLEGIIFVSDTVTVLVKGDRQVDANQKRIY